MRSSKVIGVAWAAVQGFIGGVVAGLVGGSGAILVILLLWYWRTR